MKKFSFLVISFILCCTNVVWGAWTLSYKQDGGNWTHDVAPSGDGYVYVNLNANSTYYLGIVIDDNGNKQGWAWDEDVTMTEGNSTNYNLKTFGDVTYSHLRIQTTRAGYYRFKSSYYENIQHLTAEYPVFYLPGSWKMSGSDWVVDDNVKLDDNNMLTLHLTAGQYTFKVNCWGTWYGNTGTINDHVTNWDFVDGQEPCKINISEEGDYTFTYSWNKGDSRPKVNVFKSNENAFSSSTGVPHIGMNGNIGDRWESTQSDGEWWLVKFAEAQKIDHIQIIWEGAYTKSYDLLCSNNGTDWTTIKEIRDIKLSDFADKKTQEISLDAVVTCNYLKFQAIKRGTGYGNSFYEFTTQFKNIATPTNVSVSNTGRITFDYEGDASSFEARIYKNDVLKHSQVVENNDVFNFIPTETGIYQVKVVAKVGTNTSQESVAYDWSVEAYHVYGKSAYCNYLWETTEHEGWPIYMSWETDKNGNVIIAIEPKGDEGDGITAFRSVDIKKFKVGGAAASTYFSASYAGNVMTLTLIDPTNRPVNGTIISHDGSFCYKTGTHTNAWPNLKLDYVYGTKCVASDAVNPVITTFEKASADLTSITFNVEASDEDDEGVENDVTYKVSGIPDITEQAVTLTNGQFTLTNLTPGVEYTFTLTATDPSGNYSTANVVSTTAFYPPTNIQISAMGRVSFTAAADATSYEARIYDGEDLVGTQVVAIGDMLNFISKESNYDVRLISKKGSYQSLESENYIWNAGANKVYGISNYVVSNQKTDKNEGHNADVFFTWETLKNGDVKISITNAQGEIDADYHFRGDGMNATKFYLNGSAEDFASTFTCEHTSGSAIYTLHLTGDAPTLGSIISYSGDNVTYSVPGATNAWPNTTFSYTYGTPRYPIEATNPVIASLTGESNDYTTAELTISASDMDDDNLPQTILTYILSADNDFVTTQVVPDAQGKVLLEGLKKNAIYHFHIVVSDPNGNTDEEDVEVKMKWDASVNLALAGTATAGGAQNAKPAANANDGNTSTEWGTYGVDNWATTNIWTVDLKEAYDVNRVVMRLGSMQKGKRNFAVQYSLDNEHWFVLVPEANYQDEYVLDQEVSVMARYFRVDASNNTNYVTMSEFEVYGTAFATPDTEVPILNSAEARDITPTTAVLDLVGSDNVGIMRCHVWDTDNAYDAYYVVNDDTVQLTNLTMGKVTYNLKMTVFDLYNNESNQIDIPAFRTKADPSIPQITSLAITTDKVLCPIDETVQMTPVVKDQFGADFTSVTVDYTVDAEQGSVTNHIFTPNTAFRGVATIHILATSTTDAEEYREADVKVYVNNHASNILYQKTDAIPAVNEGAVGATNTAVLTNGKLDENIAWQGSNQENGPWRIDENTETREFTCWFVADLKEVYDIEAVALYFEGASSTQYKVYFSATGEDNDWQPAYQYAISGKDNYKHNDVFYAGVVANQCSDIQSSASVSVNVRYVKFESTYGSSWGVKVNEIEVYGTHSADAEKPVVTAATLISHDDIHATINIEAEDNIGVVGYRVVDNAHDVDVYVEQESGIIYLSGLQHSTTYNLVAYAYDRQENVSDPFAMEAFTTDANTSIPMVAAPVPVHGQADVTAIYSDKFTLAMSNATNWAQWINGTIQTTGNINGNNYVHYDATASVNHQIGIGTDWKAKDEYRYDPTDENKTGINISNQEYMHIDIWCSTEGSLDITLNNEKITAQPVQLLAQQWVSFDLDYSAIPDADKQNLRWMKFTNMDGLVFAVDNIYFWSKEGITLEQASDNTEILEEYDGRYVDVTLNRTFVADGYWYTLCLPFSLTAEQLAAAYGADYDLRYLESSYMKSSDLMYLNFEKATELEAGMPYMFKPTGTGNENYGAKTFTGVVIENKTPENETDVATMTGYYSPMVIDAANYALGTDDYLYHTDGTESKAFRCYFTLNPPTSAPVRARCVFNDSHIVTNLDSNRFTDSPVDQFTKFIYNGRLVIIRDGKMYDAQGQLVK